MDFTTASLNNYIPECVSEPDLHFSEDEADIERAQDMCAPCPLRDACLQRSLDARASHGVWGGVAAPVRRLALGIAEHGGITQRYAEDRLICPRCATGITREAVEQVYLGGRWPETRVTCPQCALGWSPAAAVIKNLRPGGDS